MDTDEHRWAEEIKRRGLGATVAATKSENTQNTVSWEAAQEGADDARQTAHLGLEGNAALKFTGKSHGQTRGDRLEFWRVKQGVVPSLSDLIGGALK